LWTLRVSCAATDCPKIEKIRSTENNLTELFETLATDTNHSTRALSDVLLLSCIGFALSKYRIPSTCQVTNLRVAKLLGSLRITMPAQRTTPRAPLMYTPAVYFMYITKSDNGEVIRQIKAHTVAIYLTLSSYAHLHRHSTFVQHAVISLTRWVSREAFSQCMVLRASWLPGVPCILRLSQLVPFTQSVCLLFARICVSQNHHTIAVALSQELLELISSNIDTLLATAVRQVYCNYMQALAAVTHVRNDTWNIMHCQGNATKLRAGIQMHQARMRWTCPHESIARKKLRQRASSWTLLQRHNVRIPS
jgi:G:T/U-mismatch repair DNA glycosylase